MSKIILETRGLIREARLQGGVRVDLPGLQPALLIGELRAELAERPTQMATTGGTQASGGGQSRCGDVDGCGQAKDERGFEKQFAQGA